MLDELSARVDRLADTVARSPQTGAGSDIPVGLGLDGVGMASNLEGALVWIEPLDGAARGSAAPDGTAYGETGGDFLGSPEGGGPFDYGLETTAGAMNEPGLPRAAPAAQAVYTVPRNATLMGAVAMTALVGRVPIDGQVRDPMPFKAIAGVENLAANGLSVPGVQGMVFSGTAVGDWTLSCVTGRIESVTFVFDDGTIRTLPGPDPNEGNDGETAMGWISDERGIPCVGGERKTNAAAFLSQRMGVQAVQAAADAAAAAETTSIVALGNTGGRVTGAVTGDPGRYVLGNTLAGGSEEIARWLAERQSQHFDAVFVAAGTPVAIHIERQLDIDHDPQGRRLDHGFRKRPITSAIWTSLALAGCAGTGSKDGVLPQDGPSMRAIYESHFEGLAAADPQALRAGSNARSATGRPILRGTRVRRSMSWTCGSGGCRTRRW